MKLPGEDLVMRMWITLVEKGVGSLLRPWQIRRDGRAHLDMRTEEMVRLAQAQREVEDVLAGRRVLPGDDPLLLPAQIASLDEGARFDIELAAHRLNASRSARVVQEEVNVAKAVLQAEEILEHASGEAPDRNVDADWLTRWRNSAAEVTAEELQRMWGQVLAGEVRAPGSFSLRTIDFLRNLSQAEAALVSSISRFVVKDFVYSGAKEILEAAGLSFGKLLELQNLGVISGVGGTGIQVTMGTVQPGRFTLALMSHGLVLLIDDSRPDKLVALPIYSVTSIGQEVLRLGTFEPHHEYLTAIGKEIKTMGFEVRLATYTDDEPTKEILNYRDAVPIE